MHTLGEVQVILVSGSGKILCCTLLEYTQRRGKLVRKGAIKAVTNWEG